MAQRKLTGIDEATVKQYKDRLKKFEGKETTPSTKDKRIKEKQDDVQPDWMPKLKKVVRPEAAKEPSPSKRTFQEKMKMFESGGREASKIRRVGPLKKGTGSVRKSEVKEPSDALEESSQELPMVKRSSSRHISKSVKPGKRGTVSSRIDSKTSPGVTWAPRVGDRASSKRSPTEPKSRRGTPYPSKEKSRARSATKEKSSSVTREKYASLSPDRGMSTRDSEASPQRDSRLSPRGKSSQKEKSRTTPREPSGLSSKERSRTVYSENRPHSTSKEQSRSASRQPSAEGRVTRESSTPRGKSYVSPQRATPFRVSEAPSAKDKSRSLTRGPSSPKTRSSTRESSYKTRSPIRDSSSVEQRSRTKELSEKTRLSDKSESRARSATPKADSRVTSRPGSSPRQTSSPRSPSRRPMGTSSSQFSLDRSESRISEHRSIASLDSWDRPPTRESTQRRKSSAPAMLMPEGHIFHDIVRKGLVRKAQEFLRSTKFDINARSHDGVTALQIAVENGDEPMTAFLIGQPNIELDDILLYAVQAGDLVIVKLLCEHIGPPDEMARYPLSYSFSPDMTPLQLAAIRNSYDIINYLINKRHHKLEDPHSPDCNCPECTDARKDLLKMATQRFQQHKAVSTPAYYIHITRDPIHHSFKLYKYLKKMSRVDIVLRPSYVEIATLVKQFAVDLIGECRTSKEVRSVLSQYGGTSKFWGRLTKSELPRLIMAMDYQQDEFVAHSNVQVLLEGQWSGNFYSWRKAGRLRKTISPIIRIFVLPYIYFLLLVKPESKQARHYALPVNKMISFLATYILFLVFVFFQANETRKPRRDRMYFFSEENTVYIFIFTYTISIARQIFVTHPKRFFSQGWNVYDVIMISLYWLTLAFWMSAFTHYLMLPTPHMKNLERKYWNAFDPMLVADGFFVIASIMAFLKLLFYFQLNFSVGPMQVALNVMIKDCAKYSLFITLIIFAFTAALGKYYAYYDGMKYVDPETGEAIEQDTNSFTDLRSAFKCLFWGMFGMTDYAAADVVVENVKKPGNETENYLVEHDFTEFVGYFTFGAYTILMTIVVINMLIATMSDTFAKVLGNLDTEWMVGRTQVYLYYFYQTILPPPLNILPHRYPPKRLILADDEEKLLKDETEPEEDYNEVVRRLVARYFTKQGKT